MNKQEVETEMEMWSVVEDETTDGERCYVAYDLMRDGCMSHGRSPEEAFILLQSAKIDWEANKGV